MRSKLKRNRLIAVIIVLLVIVAAKYIYSKLWANSPSSIPKEAVWKYCSKHHLNYSSQNVKIHETGLVDANHGKQFVVEGVTGEFGDDILFFYLKDDEEGWKVVTAGTGP